MKADALQKIEDLKNNGLINADQIIASLSHWMSGDELEDFAGFLYDEYNF